MGSRVVLLNQISNIATAKWVDIYTSGINPINSLLSVQERFCYNMSQGEELKGFRAFGVLESWICGGAEYL